MSSKAAGAPRGSTPWERSRAVRDRAARYFAAPLEAWKRFKRISDHLSSDVVNVEDPVVLIEVVAACAQVRANLDGVEAEALQRIQDVHPGNAIVEELAARLTVSTRAAQTMVDRAAALDRYMEVHFALLGGDIDLAKAKVFIESTATLPDVQARAIHRAYLPDAPGLTCGQLRHRLRAAVLAVDADMAQKRHERASADRYVRAEPADDGMAYLTFYLPAVDAAAVMATLDALAVKNGPDDDRPVTARRVDAFIAIMNQVMATGATPGGTPVPTQQGKRPHLVFTVAQSTLDGQDDAPGYLAGHGPLPAELIRHLAKANPADRDDAKARPETRVVRTDAHTGVAAGSSHRRIPDEAVAALAPGRTDGAPAPAKSGSKPMTPPPAADEPEPVKSDPVQALAALGILASDAYQPGAALREHIMTRDVTCRFPTCRQPARRCQIDHIVPFDPARPAWVQTHQGNLHLLCARHHGLKTGRTWTVQRDRFTGDTLWTSPLGYEYTRPAEIIDPTQCLTKLATVLAAVRREHADDETIWSRSAPCSPGVISEEAWARYTCTDPTHAVPGACTCAKQAEDITKIVERLRPPGQMPGEFDPGDFPSTTDPPPF